MEYKGPWRSGYAADCKSAEMGSTPIGPSISRKYEMTRKLTEILTEDFDFDDEAPPKAGSVDDFTGLDDFEPPPPAEPYVDDSDRFSVPAEEHPDVWDRGNIETVGKLVDGIFPASTPAPIRSMAIAWVKATDDVDYQKTLHTIAAALSHRPSVAAKLQGCRSLTQAKEFASWALRMPAEVPATDFPQF